MNGIINEILEKENTILPAIQRNFVWPQSKICNLFDSLLNDFPIGTFLFWRVNNEAISSFTFNHFLVHYREKRFGIPRGERITNPQLPEYVGVLDGQQRITSLLIGLKGSYKVHKKRCSWDKDTSFEEQFLCVNLLAFKEDGGSGDGDEEECKRFQFVPEQAIRTLLTSDPDHPEFWVKVSDILPEKPGQTFDCADYIDEIELTYFNGHFTQHRAARKGLQKLYEAFCIKNNVNYFEATNRTLPEVVEIFVRVNSGGQKLSASDLMLSIASGELKEDAQILMSQAIEDILNASKIKGNGFKADNDLILTAGLMFTGAENLSLQKQENYTVEVINKIFGQWDKIVGAIVLASQYIEYIGFTGRTLTSKNLILPIAYYFFKNPTITKSYISSTKKRAVLDRVLIGQWLNRAMIKSIFRDGTGSTLLSIRAVIEKNGKKHFPLKELMTVQGKRSLVITDDTIDEMLDYTYGDQRTLPLLYVLNNGSPGSQYDADHIWAKKIVTGKKKFEELYPKGTPKERTEFCNACNGLANLQLLKSEINSSKADIPFNEWLNTAHPNKSDSYYADCLIPSDCTLNYADFLAFCENRSTALRSRIEECFPRGYDDILAKYSLTDN